MYGNELVTSEWLNMSQESYCVSPSDLTPWRHDRHVDLDGGLCDRADPMQPPADARVTTLGDPLARGRLGRRHLLHVGRQGHPGPLCSALPRWLL